MLLRDFEQAVWVIDHHEEYDGVQKGYNELLSEMGVALDQIGVPTIRGLALMDAMSYHRLNMGRFKLNLSYPAQDSAGLGRDGG